MFAECSLLHMELNTFNRLVVEEQCVIIVMEGVRIGEAIVIKFALSPSIGAHCIGL